MTTGALILAAGMGRRMGGVSKACVRYDGMTFLERIRSTCLKAHIEECLVVLGPKHFEEDALEAKRLDMPVCFNPDAVGEGMASSVSAGFARLTTSVWEASFLWPVDIPFVEAKTIELMSSKFEKGSVLVPHYKGLAGHPPLIAKDYFEDFKESKHDPLGAKGVMRSITRYVSIPVLDPSILKDIDEKKDLK